MFCPKCGAQMNENSTFCTSCGAKNESRPQAQAQAQPQAPQGAYQPQAPQGMYQAPNQAFSPGAAMSKRKIPFWVFIAGGAVALLIIIFAFFALKGGGSDESKVRSTVASFEKAIEKLDVNAMLKCVDTSDSDIVEEVREMGSYITSEYRNARFSFKITVKNVVVVGNIAYVEAELFYSATVNGQTDSDREETELTLRKINGKWLITYIY